MPLPTPRSREGEDDFISRCMSDETMQSEYPDEEQRAGVCYSQFRGEADLSAKNPVPLVVVRRNENGSGVVEIPVLRAGKINLEHTEGGGKGEIEITREHLKEMAANLGNWPGPVPISVSPHKPFGERSGAQPGFIEALRVRGDMLTADVFLFAPLFMEVMEGLWRGFSVEIARNLKLATVEIEGWAVYGGVFTNRPATDVHFRVPDEEMRPPEMAAESAVSVSLSLRPETPEATEVRKMSDTKDKAPAQDRAEVTTASLESLRVEFDKTRTALQSRLDTVEADNRKLREEHAELRATADTVTAERDTFQAQAQRLGSQVSLLQGNVKDLEDKLQKAGTDKAALEDQMTGEKVVRLVAEAIDGGVAPAHFEGHEKNPAEWVRSNWGSFETFEKHVAAITGLQASPPKGSVRSGHDPSKTDEDEKDLTFEAANNEEEARKVFEAKQAEKKKE